MPNQLLPKRWASQPQYPVGIDRSNPLTQGLLVAFSPSVGNAVSGTPLPAYDSGALVSVYGVLCAKTSGAASGSVSLGASPTYLVGTGDMTMFTIVSPVAASGTQVIMGKYSGSGDDFYLASQASTVYFSISATQCANTVATMPVGAFSTVVGRRASGQIWVTLNGISTAKTANVNTANASGALRLGQFGDAGGFNFSANYACAYLWSRALSDAEIASLSANPWQIFAPSLS